MGFPCVVSIELESYLDRIDELDRRDAAIEARTLELMEMDDELNPHELIGFNEGLYSLENSYVIEKLLPAIKSADDAKLGKAIRHHIVAYLTKQAMIKAESEVCNAGR